MPIYWDIEEKWSPSMRREWIEIIDAMYKSLYAKSPSMRREWIEIVNNTMYNTAGSVSLHAEGVD